MTTWPQLKKVRADAQDTELYRFGEKFFHRLGRSFSGQYKDLHRASVENLEEFWSLWLDESGLIADRGQEILAPRQSGTFGARFFRDSKLNFAENCLEAYKSDEQIALVYRDHLPDTRREMTVGDVKAAVSRYAQILKNAGVGEGDRVAAYVGNIPEAACFALATGYLGAVFSIIGPGNETKSVLDRFAQIEPTVLLATDERTERIDGTPVDRLETSREIANGLSTLRQVILMPRHPDKARHDLSGFRAPAAYLDTLLAGIKAQPLTYKRFPFNSPLYILYSSGTSGNPKCITHGAGGTLLEHLKEHKLHGDIRPGDIAFFQTNSEWMMWHYNLSHMACGATVILSDLNVKYEDLNVLFRVAREEKVTMLGSFAGFFNTLERRQFVPTPKDALKTVRQLQSTGSRLLPQTFRHIYETWNFKGEIASISGGTDIVGCFVGGSPLSPVHEGVSQCITLGMDVRAFNEDGEEQPAGAPGELVCCQPFPNMPVKFWGDESGEKYRDAYFAESDEIWHHGDEVIITPECGAVILGRSDETLKINGNRVGPVEIVSCVEQIEGVREAAVVGRNIEGSDYPVLFLVLEPGYQLDAGLKQKIASAILAQKPAYCVPPENYVFAVKGLPRAGVKLSLIALKRVINGRAFTGKEKMTPENQAYLQEVEDLAICNLAPSRKKAVS